MDSLCTTTLLYTGLRAVQASTTETWAGAEFSGRNADGASRQLGPETGQGLVRPPKSPSNPPFPLPPYLHLSPPKDTCKHSPSPPQTHCSRLVKKIGNSAIYPLSCDWLGDRELYLEFRGRFCQPGTVKVRGRSRGSAGWQRVRRWGKQAGVALLMGCRCLSTHSQRTQARQHNVFQVHLC